MMNSGHRWAFEHGILWAMDLSNDKPSPVSPRVATVFKEVRIESIEVLAQVMDLPDPEPIRRRLIEGRRCFAGWVEDQIAVYGWVSHGAERIGELEREICMPADEAYIWDCFTLPTFRRQRLYSALLSYMVAELSADDVRRIWIGSSRKNEPSIRGFANAGFQPIITMTYVRLFNLCGAWIMGHPTAPRTLVMAARQALTTSHEWTWGALVIGWSQAAQRSPSARSEA